MKTKLQPFITRLSDSDEKYFELLSSKNAMKMNSGYITLKQGESIGRHSTMDNEEIIIVLQGEGELEVEDKKNIISAGDIAYNPPQTFHNVINRGSKDLKYIFVVSKA